MRTFRRAIKRELRRIQRLVDLVANDAELNGAGRLSVERRNGNLYCYEIGQKDGKRVKKYLGRPEESVVQELVKRRFLKEKLSRMDRNWELLKKMEKEYKDYDDQSVYHALPRSYQDAGGRSYLNKRYEELRAWAKADYPRNPYPFPETEIYAKDGTRMRSKDEGIIYDMLYDLGIPFRYDSMIKIRDDTGKTKTVCPDFLIQCFDGTFIVIEHLGRLFDLKYAIDFGEKCYWYLQMGCVLNVNFFTTSDSKQGGIDINAVRKVVYRVEERFYGF